MITLHHFLVISAILFSFGLFGVITRRNTVALLMGIELILNSANLNLIAFAKYSSAGLDGQLFAIFVIIIAAAEAAVALAIVLNIYRNTAVIEADKADQLKG